MTQLYQPQSKKSKVQHKKRKSCTYPSLLLSVQTSSLTVLSASAGTSSRENVVKRFPSQIAFFKISFKLSWVLNRPGPQSSTSRIFSASHWLSKRIFRPILVNISFEPSAKTSNSRKRAKNNNYHFLTRLQITSFLVKKNVLFAICLILELLACHFWISQSNINSELI